MNIMIYSYYSFCNVVLKSELKMFTESASPPPPCSLGSVPEGIERVKCWSHVKVNGG